MDEIVRKWDGLLIGHSARFWYLPLKPGFEMKPEDTNRFCNRSRHTTVYYYPIHEFWRVDVAVRERRACLMPRLITSRRLLPDHIRIPDLRAG
jgi:hypothetical protein